MARRPRHAVLVAALLVAAAALSACRSPLPVATVAGRVTSGGSAIAVAADPTCPRDELGAIEARVRWTARIAAHDPREWLRIDACQGGSTALGGAPIEGGPFVIFTSGGELRGTASGSITWDTYDRFTFVLRVGTGTGVYARAGGSLWYQGCLHDRWVDGSPRPIVVAATLSARRPADGEFPAACTPTPDDTLLGPVAAGTRLGVAGDAACATREHWGVRITARDPREWVGIDACVAAGAGAGTDRAVTGTFAIYTATGDVRGTVEGQVRDGPGNSFVFGLEGLSGSGDYLWIDGGGRWVLSGCERAGTIVSGSLQHAYPPVTLGDLCPTPS